MQFFANFIQYLNPKRAHQNVSNAVREWARTEYKEEADWAISKYKETGKFPKGNRRQNGE
jgi:hypothetical protein